MAYHTFEVVTDDAGRIEHFETVSADGPIRPSWVRDSYFQNDGNRVVLDDEEYELTQEGNLIHPEVTVPPHVILGSGVRIDEGTEFKPWHLADNEHEGRVFVGDRTRINGTRILDHVYIGRMCVIDASIIVSYNVIGDGCEFGRGSSIYGASGFIGDNVKVGDGAEIGARVQIDDDVTIASGARIGLHARIGKGAIIDKPGEGYNPEFDFGPSIGQYERIAPGARVYKKASHF